MCVLLCDLNNILLNYMVLQGFIRFLPRSICDINKMIIPFSRACEASRSARSSWSCCSSFLGAWKTPEMAGKRWATLPRSVGKRWAGLKWLWYTYDLCISLGCVFHIYLRSRIASCTSSEVSSLVLGKNRFPLYIIMCKSFYRLESFSWTTHPVEAPFEIPVLLDGVPGRIQVISILKNNNKFHQAKKTSLTRGYPHHVKF